MKVIGAGLSKTGTNTLHEAFTILGYKSYHYFESVSYHGEEWSRILTEGWKTEDFKRMYANLDAVFDGPGFYFWEEIHKAFPEAKIILSVRESEDVWLESLINQMKVMESNFLFRLMEYLSPSYRETISGILLPMSKICFGIPDLREIRWENHLNRELMKQKYRMHNRYVIQNAPKDKLLVYKASEGWEPLCKFLGIPVPDEPFPHKNKKGKIISEYLQYNPLVIRMKREMFVSCTVLVIVVPIAGYSLYRRGVNNLFESCLKLF
uniref:uncharacterized protein LOC120339780 n=1 Tax=Styela clava TaxID=7725 RepID=UPI001939DCC0|nr:uncharacterized protein LOC120339780 [Styela clava]